VLEAVVSWGGHFSAEELCSALPHVSRATVYRVLASLQRAGVLCRVVVDRSAPRYQIGSARHHHHLVCLECNAVQDIAGCGVNDVVATVASGFGYEPVGHRVEIYGRCASCRSRG